MLHQNWAGIADIAIIGKAESHQRHKRETIRFETYDMPVPPGGTDESSPPFQRRENGNGTPKSPQGTTE